MRIPDLPPSAGLRRNQPMICPRCALAELSGEHDECRLCGYSAPTPPGVAIVPTDSLEARIRAELGSEFRIERETRRGDHFRSYVAMDSDGPPVVLTVYPRSADQD